jgi:SAM-dependent methyltransferase
MSAIHSTDYASHDLAYQKLRERGAIGWDNDSAIYAEMRATILPLLPSTASGSIQRVLEIGCGAGNASVMLAERGYEVTGIDIAPTAIDWATVRAKSAAANASFRVDNVLDLATCKDAEFDAVVDGHCLHCIIGQDRQQCLASVHRVLKLGGVFVVLTMCGDVTNPRMLESFDPFSSTTVHSGRPTRYIGHPDLIAAEVVAAGFSIDKMDVIERKNVDDLDTLVIRAIKG